MKRHVIYRWFFDYEKEEVWLNQMAAKGMNFINFALTRYLFEEGTPGEFIYRIELLPQLVTHPESQDYIRFMESIGVEYVGKWGRWAYFRKKSTEGPFEIFSDIDSKIKHYKSIFTLFLIVGLGNAIPGMNLFNIMLRRPNHYISPFISLNFTLAVVTLGLAARYFKKLRGLKKTKQLYE